MRTFSGWLAMIVAFLFTYSCGDNSGPSAQDKCEMLLDTACDRIEECAKQLSGEPAPAGFHKMCIDVQKTEVDCARATSVDQSYDECVSEIRTFSCNVFLTADPMGNIEANLPISCEGVINGT